MKEKQFISYREAVKGLDLVLCNLVTEHHELIDYIFRYEDYIDEELIEEVNENYYETEEEKQEAIKDKALDKALEDEIFQYYLTNADTGYVKYLSNKYGLKFAFCEDLDLWVLLVNYWGTSWDDVKVKVKG